MFWRTDTPTESPIVAYLEGSNIPEVLLLAHKPYPHYYDNAGEEIPTGMIQKWASLSETSTPSNLDEAAEEYAKNNYLAPDFMVENLAGKYDSEIDEYIFCTADAFKAGAEWMAGQFQKIDGDLVDWYRTSDGKDYCCGISTNDAFEVPEGFYIRKK